MIDLVAGLVGALVSGGPGWFQVAKDWRTQGEFTNLKKAMDKVKGTSGRGNERYLNAKAEQELKSDKHFERLAHWLDIGESIHQQMQKRLLRNFLMIITSSVLLGLGIGVDTSDGGVFSLRDSIESQDLSLVLVGWMVALLKQLRDQLPSNMTETEREFMRNLHGLREQFYSHFVLRAAEEFNKEYATFFADGEEALNCMRKQISSSADKRDGTSQG